MKQLNRGQGITLGLAVIAAGLAAQPVIGASAAPAPKSEPSIVSRLRDAASGQVDLRSNPATGRVGFARAEGANADLMPGVAAEGRQAAIDKATAYLDEFAPAFGARPAELKQTEVFTSRAGWTVTYAQSYKGVPVFAGELKAHVDRDGDLTAVNGFAAPAIDLSVTPAVSKAAATERALGAVAARPSGHEDGLPAKAARGLSVRTADLTIYETGSPRGIAGEARLAWAIEVWNKSTIRETLIMDAVTGKPLNRWSMIADALNRELYEAYLDDHGTPDDDSDDTVGGLDTPVWSEGDAFPGDLDEDQQNEVLGTSEAYWMFRNTFGYNAWDGAGGKMITVNNDPRIDCPNANWNGVTTNYCSGVTSDDTVAHEWAHAYTESTSGLIYQWQAGAMNEAYSDIWGETVDSLNDRFNEQGEDNATGGAILREEGKCSVYQPAAYEVNVTILAPASIAGPCTAAPAAFGPEITGTNTVDVVVAQDVDTDGDANDPITNDSTTNGCNTFSNAAAVAGKWAFADRGFCTFQVKLNNAKAAGAVGLVLGDNRPEAPFSPSGTGDIPGILVTQADGTRIKSVTGPVSMQIQRVVDPLATDDSYRWLSGEGDPAFGGAIRDMWNPNCFGDPGKVSDEEYYCNPDDSGGVHTNSGVVNRTFAILVDGLPGKVDSIGLDKAAWLFWRSQTNYLTPTSYFPDLADALEASCDDLTGIDIEEVTLGDPKKADGSDGAAAAAIIDGGMTAADCAAVSDAIAETELRLDPTAECDWKPILAGNAPSLSCGAGTTTTTSWSEDFEDGLQGWTQDEELGFPEAAGYAWKSSSSAPGGHDGGVAFGPDPVEGTCSGLAGDITSRNGLISPAVTVPAGTTPRMSFDHYVATEAKWDGGNVKVSVNGGAFTLVPTAAYIFNGPGGTLDPQQGTSMAGQPAWTGTNGGVFTGSWGTSIIDLGKLAKAGDTVKFRFDMGRDGCNGIDGWYVDNVKVQVCATPGTPTTTPTPTPTPAPAASDTAVKVKPRKPSFRENFKVVVKVDADGAATPTGKVVMRIDGKVMGKGRVKDGKVVFRIKRDYAIGKHVIQAKYKGSDTVEHSKERIRFRVVR